VHIGARLAAIGEATRKDAEARRANSLEAHRTSGKHFSRHHRFHAAAAYFYGALNGTRAVDGANAVASGATEVNRHPALDVLRRDCYSSALIQWLRIDIGVEAALAARQQHRYAARAEIIAALIEQKAIDVEPLAQRRHSRRSEDDGAQRLCRLESERLRLRAVPMKEN